MYYIYNSVNHKIMEEKERRKEIYKNKLICLFVLIFSSLYLFDEEVSYIKIGIIIFVMSYCINTILSSFKYYIETGKRVTLTNKNHYLFFSNAYPKSELYNDILAIMMILSWLISICIVIYGVYVKISNFL